MGGSIVANQPLTIYLGNVTVHGNFISIGGGDPERNFPIKDNTIDGNVFVFGWKGLWMGLIRNTVGGSVWVLGNRAADTSVLPGSDSTEVQTNDISHNLICLGNSPRAQVNPDDVDNPTTSAAPPSASAPGLTTGSSTLAHRKARSGGPSSRRRSRAWPREESNLRAWIRSPPLYPTELRGLALLHGILCRRVVAVAQLVEPRVVIPVVAGSSPVRHLFAPIQDPRAQILDRDDP